MRRFELSDSTSNKFWEVAVKGKTLHVTFGKIGTKGQSKPKDFATPEKAKAEMEKLIKEKMGKGYVEVGGKAVKAAKSSAKLPAAKKTNAGSMGEGLSKAEKKAKAEKVLAMFAGGQWELARGMLEVAQEEHWLFEELLKGCKIKGGIPIPSVKIMDVFGEKETSEGYLYPDDGVLYDDDRYLDSEVRPINSELLMLEMLLHLPNTHQGQITDPNNGYPAKTMSTEAGELWFKHKGFWLAQYYIPIKEKEAQKKELVSVGQETLKTASAKAGVSLKELNQKLERLSTLAKGEDLDLAIRMVSDFDDVWLFESLLAGSTIDKDGYLVPGKPLKMFKAHAEFFGILALVNAPESTNLHASLNKTKLQYFKINDPVLEMLDLYGKHIVKKCPTLRGTGNLNFGGLKSLSAGTAEALSMHIGGLSLNELTSLSDDAAKALGMHYGYLSLNGLTNLSNAGAESLSRHDGGLYLDGLKTLNNATAEALSKHEGELHLGGLKNLSDAAAKALGKHKGELSLGGLASLGDSPGHIALAEKFSSQKGELGLSSLKSLSDAAAEALSKHEGELDLSGLKSLSDATAEALSKHKGDLDCSYLESLSDSPGHVALAKKLASQKGELNLWRLKSLGDAAAKALSMYKKDLRIDDLVSLNDSPGHVALAVKLASQKRKLYLRGLKSLSDGAAEALSKHKGELSLWGLKSLSDTVAKSLSKHKGPLNLQGLKSLSSAVAEALSKHEGDLDLMGLNSLSDFPGHVALAGKLARQKGDLRLYYLKSLSDSAAEALSKREGKLDLHGLKSLSDAAAEALSKFEGDLNLDGLKSLSDAGAQALAKKKGGKHKMSLPSEIQKQVDKYKKK